MAYEHQLVLHGEDGAVLGTCAVHAGVMGPTRVKPGQFDPLATAHHVRPCASGRLVAYGESLVSSRGTEHKLLVADLRTGKAHAYGAPGVVVDVLWSSSGRSVHALLEQRDGALRVLVVEVERAAPSP